MALKRCRPKISDQCLHVALPTEGSTTVVKFLEVHVLVGSDEQENNFSVLASEDENLT